MKFSMDIEVTVSISGFEYQMSAASITNEFR